LANLNLEFELIILKAIIKNRMTLRELEPKIVWEFFDDITKIPRPSKKEEKIIAYLLEFAKKYNLQAKKDLIGNVVIRKPATVGFENKKSIVLQSHLDMVCEKNEGTEHNFETDSIQTYIDNGWVKAKGTTLGADDGIGVAAQLAILAATDLKHGAIECLFTIDEESGMSGAFNLEENFIESKILLNLDSEDEGELYIGCAGGKDTVATFTYEEEKLKKGEAFRITVKGLKGGHSGDDINKGLGNSIKILNRFLFELINKIEYKLSLFDGGNLRNAIPREAFADIVISSKKKEIVEGLANEFTQIIRNELGFKAPDALVVCEEIKLPKTAIDKEARRKLLLSLYACPHGEIRYSDLIPDLVETSTNLASVKFAENSTIVVTTSQRSSVESAKTDIVNMVQSVFRLADAKVKSNSGYPGWQPNQNSEILAIASKSYESVFGNIPKVKAIHAGLECGLFLEKYPYLDMVSFGPTIKGAHSPDERLEIKTVQMFWDWLLHILENAPEK